MIVIINIQTRPVKHCETSQAINSRKVTQPPITILVMNSDFDKCSFSQDLSDSEKKPKEAPQRTGKTHKAKVLEYLQSLTLPAIIDRDDISKAAKIAPKDCVSALGRLRKDGLISYSYADKFKAFVILGVSESNGVSESDNPLFDGACPWESPQTMS